MTQNAFYFAKGLKFPLNRLLLTYSSFASVSLYLAAAMIKLTQSDSFETLMSAAKSRATCYCSAQFETFACLS